MSRTFSWLLIGGALGGAYWLTRRSRHGADEELEARISSAAGRYPDERAPTTSVSPAAHREATSGLSRQFDELFRVHGQRIPVPYLRALAQAESGMNPNDRLGLINVVPIALADYNRRHPDRVIAPAQMRDPATNIRVAADTLRTIIASYERHHGDVKHLRENWQNPRFVELLTGGWNAGFSERAGVGRVVRVLKDRKVPSTDITLDAVFRAAPRIAGVADQLSNPRKLAYAKGVAAAFFRELNREGHDHVAPAAAVA